jgi:GT2 family glycosyltransferase
MKQLSLIILTYNSEAYIYDCLKSVFQYNDIGDSLEVIVVDNNSRNYQLMYDRIKLLYPQVQIIPNDQNGGYGQGNNIGVRASTSPIVAIMNPDVRLIMPVFGKFIETLSDEHVIMCGGKQFATLTQANPSFYYDFTESGFRQTIGHILCHKLDKYNEKRMWLQGAFFAIKKYEFEQIGLFDENIFMYEEECDIHIRIKKSISNFSIKYLPQLKYIHLTEKRPFSEKATRQQLKSQLYLCTKYNIPFSKFIWTQRLCLNINLLVQFVLTRSLKRSNYHTFRLQLLKTITY